MVKDYAQLRHLMVLATKAARRFAAAARAAGSNGQVREAQYHSQMARHYTWRAEQLQQVWLGARKTLPTFMEWQDGPALGERMEQLHLFPG